MYIYSLLVNNIVLKCPSGSLIQDKKNLSVLIACAFLIVKSSEIRDQVPKKFEALILLSINIILFQL